MGCESKERAIKRSLKEEGYSLGTAARIARALIYGKKKKRVR